MSREYPFKDCSGFDLLTVGDLKKVLENVPDDYLVKFDGYCGRCSKDEFSIDHEDKEISVNM